MAKETQPTLEVLLMVSSLTPRIPSINHRVSGNKSNASAYLSQRGDVSYLILRQLNKGSLTLSTEGLASYSAPWGGETGEMSMSRMLERAHSEPPEGEGRVPP